MIRHTTLALALGGAVAAAPAAAQSTCPPNSEPYAQRTEGNTTIIRCRCIRPFVLEGGQCRVHLHILIRAFIPNRHPGNPTYIRPVPGAAGQWVISAPVGSDCFTTDHRWFSPSPDASARITSEALLVIVRHTAGLGAAGGRPMQRAGATHRVDCQTGRDLVAPQTAGTGSMRFGTPVWSGGVAQFSVSAQGRNPMTPPVAPAIDYSGTFTFDSRARTLAFRGSIGKFPAFEAYASLNGGPMVTLFQEPPAPGSTAWHLYDAGIGANTRRIDVRVALP